MKLMKLMKRARNVAVGLCIAIGFTPFVFFSIITDHWNLSEE